MSFLLTLLLTRSYAINSDEGYTLNGAWQVWNGMKMYDDFRQFVGPGSSYSIHLLWLIVGRPSYLAARFLSLVLSFSATTAVYLVLKREGVRGINLAFSIVTWTVAGSIYAVLNHNSFSTFAATWFLLLFLRISRQPEEPWKKEGADDKHQILDHALVGAAAGIVFILLPTKGLSLAVGAAAFAFSVGFKNRDYRPGSALGAGFIAVVAPIFLIWRPALLLRQWLVIPLTGHYLDHTEASSAIAITAVALICGMGWIAIRRQDRSLKVLAITQGALFACMTHNMEIHHLAINSFPAIIFVSVLMNARSKLKGRVERLSSEMTMAIVMAVFMPALVLTPDGRDFFRSSTLNVDVLMRRPRAKLFSNRRVVEAPAIYAGPFLPGLYFELKKKNPYFVSETIVCDEECQQRLIAQLSVTKPELVFLHYDMIPHLGYDRNSPVDVYLRDRYPLCQGDHYGSLIIRASDARWCP